MQVRILSTVLRAGFAIVATVLLVTTAWGTDHQTVLYNFGNDMDGVEPGGGLIMDSAGNLYGVTSEGGFNSCLFGCGTAFELSPKPGGGWTETVLHDFGGGSNDGILPVGGLVMDRRGNLFGVTVQGGLQGDGTVFELSPDGSGDWTETVLYNFGTNSAFPSGGLTMDAAGNLYGTAEYGGSYGWGTVFELSPSLGGNWSETTLHSFGSGNDGTGPLGSLIMDAAGNLYGTTYAGGEGEGFCRGSGCGTAFEVSPGVSGWTETVLHSFNGEDGTAIWAGLVMDAAGNLYGTALQGGDLTGENCAPFGCGTVFELSLNGGGEWTETTLRSFGGPPDTGYPQAPLILDSAGNLYGTGSGCCSFVPAAVFELSPRQGGWVEALPFIFNPNSGPTSGVILDRFGELYGEAGGGLYGGGIAYKLTPPSIRPGPHAH
jgi:uncharacterized repeat protein (TIGR03803 family)